MLAELVKQSGVPKDAIDGLCVSSFSLAPDTAVGLTQHLGVSPRWLDHVPMGGASGVVAVRRAARAVQAGDADIVACITGDTNHVDSFRQMLGSFSAFARDATYPYGSGGPNSIFAFITAHTMRTRGADARGLRPDLRRAAPERAGHPARDVQEAADAGRVPGRAAHRRPDPPVRLRDALRRRRGVLVMSEARARDLGLPFVHVLAATERHNAWRDDPIMIRGGWSVDRDELYAMAGIRPNDLDFVQFYDDYPVIVMMQFEDHGLCAEGEGADFVRAHTLDCDGTMPTNTSGGQLSIGQAGAAGGYLGLVETVRQLTDRPLGKAVPDANVGLVSGFGMITYDRCLCTGALILGRAS